MALIISECAKNLNFIKMNYREATSKRLVSTSPDTVYLKTMVHTALLPDDAGSWPFVLPWVFFNALTAQHRSAMQKDRYVLPSPVGLLIKSKQINAMAKCRNLSRVSYKAVLDMGEQIKAFFGQGKGGLNASSQHYHVNDGIEEDGGNDDDLGRRRE